MRMKQVKHRFQHLKLRTKLWMCLIPIILSITSTGAMIIFENNSIALNNESLISINQYLPDHGKNQTNVEKVKQVLKKTRHRIMMMLLTLSAVILITFFFLFRNIISPLEKIHSSIDSMTEGKLHHPLPIYPQDEIGHISNGINEFSINVQEMLLYVWNHCDQFNTLLENVTKTFQTHYGEPLPPEIMNDIDFIRTNIENLRTFVRSFEFFEVQLNSGKLMSVEKLKTEPYEFTPS